MKKLLIAMTAAAVGTCAWAEEVVGGEGDSTPAAPTMLNESFGANWTLQAPWSYWSGAETATPAEGELTAGDALSLNTGSKVLRGNFMSDGSAKDIDTGLYFNATVTFKDPSDTLPTLGEADKFALVVLDNVESIDAEKATDPATNLWVIAKYGDAGQRAYQLDVEVTPSWLATEHTIVVKAYDNVMASGNCAGFLVKVDNEDNDTVCTVVQSCAIVDGVIDFGVFCAGNNFEDDGLGGSGNLGYLGYPKSAILGAVQKRYTDGTLILSNVPGSDTLASVDFQGQGVIDDVSLATTGSGFGTDSLALTVVADGVTLVDTDETLYFAAIGDKVTIKFTVNEGFELSSPTGLTPVDGVYTYEYITKANNEEVTISAFLPVVSVVVDGETKKFASLSEAIDEVDAGAELTLTDAITLTEAIDVTEDITINLNGKTLSATLTDEFASMFALADGVTLTITDTTGGVLQITGEVDRLIAKGPDRATIGAAVAINAGTIKADIANANSITYALTGGQYDTDVSAVLGGNYVATKAEGSEYWTVAEKVIVKYTVSASYDNTQVSVSDLTTGEVEANTVLSFTVAANTGFQNVVVKAGDTVLEPTNGTYTWTVVANVTITITAEAVVVGPSIDDPEGDITVDETTGDATIDTTNATVTVTGTVNGDVIVTPSVGTVNVTLAQGKTVKVYSGETDISGAFTVVTEGGTTTIDLNPEGEVEINGAKIKVMPEMAQAGNGEDAMKAPLEVGTDVAVGVKTIPGLMYQLIRSDAPNGTFEGVGDAVKGTGVPVKLEDKNKPNGKGFYKIKVSQR